jgi:SAM-dependent methyltransferase
LIMSMPYQVMYRIGFTPWDRHEPPAPLVDLVGTLPAGQMLDIGCGTGHDAIWCEARGWRVTGIDAVSVALRRARRNAKLAGADIRFIQADIARVTPAALGSGYTLLQDIGCFGGLSDPDRRRAAATITAVAAPGARLLMFAFGQGGGRFGPRRIDLPEIRALFPAWDIMFSRSADEIDIKGPMRDAARAWHQLVRQPPAEATRPDKQ